MHLKELIEKLRSELKKHGNIPVTIPIDGDPCEIVCVETPSDVYGFSDKYGSRFYTKYVSISD